jgi:hypothetical protein
MQKDKDKDKDKIITSVEIVDVPPKDTETNTILNSRLAEVGATELTKEEVYRLLTVEIWLLYLRCQKMVLRMSRQYGPT